MVEYIPRNEAIAELRHRCYPCGEGIEAINGIPAADVAPVVRCKDCAHLYGTLCTVCGLLPQPDDFCSYGERRDKP